MPHGFARRLEGTTQTVAGVDPGGDPLRDQSGARVSFRQIHGPTGKRIRYEKVVPGVGRASGGKAATRSTAKSSKAREQA